MAFIRPITKGQPSTKGQLTGWLWLLVCLLFTPWANAHSWPLQLKLNNNGQLHQLQYQPHQNNAELGLYKAQSGIELYLSGDWLVQTSQTVKAAMWQQLGVEHAKLLAQIGEQQIWLVQPVQAELWFNYTLPAEQFPWLLAYQPDFHAKAAKLQGSAMPDAKLASEQQAILTQAYWQALQHQTSGQGAVIALIDDAVNLTAKALAELQVQLYYDVDQKTTQHTKPQTTPQNTQQAGSVTAVSHGDKMAALLFAQPYTENSVTSHSGLAPKATAVILKQSLGWTSDIVLALHLAELAGADVINCSWTLPFLSDLIAQKIDHLTKQPDGIAVVAAAGNHRQDVAESNPLAALPGVISVGLLDSRLQLLSNSGKVDIWVQGPLYLPDGTGISGSSAAAAVVSGVLALKRSLQPDLPITQLTGQLKTELTNRAQ
ncbi:S8/S53 family peptidase [Rheinheimera mangrovi]|uniref:S8/S53 family peptidase n=1 Tax=Rheinheimera mangrovi TaxID=2498451 RepID=UPI000F8F6FAD|nr:S8/S53 family peptidase [Rheinheimera mangrovi]